MRSASPLASEWLRPQVPCEELFERAVEIKTILFVRKPVAFVVLHQIFDLGSLRTVAPVRPDNS